MVSLQHLFLLESDLSKLDCRHGGESQEFRVHDDEDARSFDRV
jgi:hypothetical protein